MRDNILFIFLLILLSGCAKKAPDLDALLRSRADGMNKEAFLLRYSDPIKAIEKGQSALRLIADSLPSYTDGRLRAWNSLALDYFMLGKNDSAANCLERVRQAATDCPNAEIELAIAQLLQARLLQTSCNIADSYSLLYEIDHSRILQKNRKNFLYDFAQMEYYITSLALNYHFRNGALGNVEDLMSEIEETRGDLKCDYAEDLALNYAMAHSCYRLAGASDAPDQAALLDKCLTLLDRNQQILNTDIAYCDYHQANVWQLQAFIGSDTSIDRDVLYSLRPELTHPDSVKRLYQISTELFFNTPDPYQHLGAVVTAADYCLSIGDTAEAYIYYAAALMDTCWHDGFAPKFEAWLYDGLLRSKFEDNPDINRAWYAREMELQSLIQQNQKDDFVLQHELDNARHENSIYTISLLLGVAVLIALTVMLILLRKQKRDLKHEKSTLQKAQQDAVERIANVETCLSVLRHDINPFLSYLQNKRMPEELRQEVTEQLLRTFNNIKNWTNLSIPSGLQFRPSHFPLQEVMDSVESTSINASPKRVQLTIIPSPLRAYGDKQLIEILLRNLTANALRHTQEGSVTLKAEPYAEDAKFIHLMVSDTGCGMDEDTLDSLFRPDKKIQDTQGGSGFGLILCKYIIKLHDDNTTRGCRIWAESTLGKGSIFHALIAKAD